MHAKINHLIPPLIGLKFNCSHELNLNKCVSETLTITMDHMRRLNEKQTQ